CARSPRWGNTEERGSLDVW
nr:immunoglobulin heavy chain junction region [Macaca mulatta]